MHSTIAAPELSMQFNHDYFVLEMFARRTGNNDKPSIESL